jgi:pyrroline-5-carboxylate reductase
MKFGFVGAGNMARSYALGLAEPADFSDPSSERAQALAELTGGSVRTTPELAQMCDAIFLAHKPQQLAEVAEVLDGFSGTIVSMLAATTLDSLRAALPEAKVVRTIPNIPVAFGCGVLGVAEESDEVEGLDEYFNRLGTVVRCPESQFEVFTAVSSCAPAFFALFERELIRSAAEHGMDPKTAALIVNETMAGSAVTLRENGIDPDDLMTRVASPGGLTERALADFEANGLAAVVDSAVATVLGE